MYELQFFSVADLNRFREFISRKRNQPRKAARGLCEARLILSFSISMKTNGFHRNAGGCPLGLRAFARVSALMAENGNKKQQNI